MKRPQNVGTAATRLSGRGGKATPPDTAEEPRVAGRPGRGEDRAVAAKGAAPTPSQPRTPAPPVSPRPRAVPPPAETEESTPPGETVPSVRAAARSRRRYERSEVKRFTRASRRRRRAWLIGIGVAVLVLVGAALVPLSPLMSLHTIEVDGTQRLSATAVEKALAPQLGTPLALVDERTIGRELSVFPLIRSYSTQVEPPGTLVVHIVERTPLLLLQSGKDYRLVDQAGVAIETTPTRPAGYPLLSVPSGASAAQRAAEFTAAADVVAALPTSMREQVSGVSATGTQSVAFTLGSGRTVVWGGPEDSDLKAAVLAGLLKAAPDASVYDVSAPNSPVTR